MSVVLSIEDVGPCRKQLKIEVPAPAVEAETQRVINEFRKRTKLPGFRKGKVPSGLIQQKFQRDIEQEVVERLVPRYWRQAAAESELSPLMPPSVDEVDFQAGVGLTFLASVDTRPEIALGDIETFELPEMEIEPSDEEIETAIQDMRRAVAEWVEVDRSAVHGDMVTGQLTETTTDSGAEARPQSVSFEVGDEQIWEELSLAVTGKRSGQTADLERREDDEAPVRRYRIEIESVRERDVPELDDALAVRLGDFENVAALVEDVGTRLRRAKRLERRRKRERALLDQLRERHPLELPAGVVDHEIEGMLREYAHSLVGSGVDPQSSKIDWQALAEQVRPQAERRVHARLLLDAVVEKLGVEVGEDEFERALTSIARARSRSAAVVRQELDRSGRLAGLREQMLREKALRNLLGEPAAGETDAPKEAVGDDSPAEDQGD